MAETESLTAEQADLALRVVGAQLFTSTSVLTTLAVCLAVTGVLPTVVCVLIACAGVGYALVTLRFVRRRNLARVAEASWPGQAGAFMGQISSRLPLPRWLSMSVAGTVLAEIVTLVFVIGAGSSTCAAKGISTRGRVGICVRGGGLLGQSVTYNVVDAGQSLIMPGYQARLTGSTLAPIIATGPFATPTLYPDHHGLLVSFEVEITNTGEQSLALPVSQTIDAEIPDSPGSQAGNQWWPSAGVASAPRPQLDTDAPLPAGQSETGWVSFILPPAIQSLLRARLSDLEFYRADGSRGYVGQIRLWKAANPAGNLATEFASQPASTTG